MPGHHHACDTRMADAVPKGEGEVVTLTTDARQGTNIVSCIQLLIQNLLQSWSVDDLRRLGYSVPPLGVLHIRIFEWVTSLCICAHSE